MPTLLRLVLGNVGLNLIAQLLTLGFIPLLSRVYDLGSYGRYAVFLGTLTLIAVFAGYRLDVAALSVRTDAEAHRLLSISVLLSCGVALAVPLLGLLPPLSGLGVLLALATPLTVMVQAATGWLVRSQRLPPIAVGRLVGTLVTGGSQLWLGHIGLAQGLLVGFVLGTAANALALTVFWRPTLERFSLRQVLGEHRAYGVTSALAAAVNTLTLQAPQFILGSFYGPATTGAFAIAQRLTVFPVTLLAQPLSQAYSGRASASIREGNGIGEQFRPFFLLAALTALLLAAGIVLVSPWALSHLLSARWSSARAFLPVSAAMLLPTLVMGTVGSSLNLLRKTALQFGWEVTRLAGVGLVVGLTVTTGQGATTFLWAFLLVLVAWAGLYAALVLTPERSTRAGVRRPEVAGGEP